MENLKPISGGGEKLHLGMKEVTETLRSAFGIDNLSNNELFIIKKITEDVMERVRANNTKGTDLALINQNEEICTRFLIEAYGIDVRYLKENTETEKDMEGFLEYIRRVRERAHLI